MTDHGALAMHVHVHVHVCTCIYYAIIIMTIVCMCVHPVMRQKELCYVIMYGMGLVHVRYM